MIFLIVWVIDWYYLFMIEDWELGYRGLLAFWSRLVGKVWIVILVNRVDILILVIVFFGVGFMSLLWKLFKFFFGVVVYSFFFIGRFYYIFFCFVWKIDYGDINI